MDKKEKPITVLDDSIIGKTVISIEHKAVGHITAHHAPTLSVKYHNGGPCVKQLPQEILFLESSD